MGRIYCTTFCNHGHDIETGRPVGHECYVLPPAAISAERAGDHARAVQYLEWARSSGKLGNMVKGRGRADSGEPAGGQVYTSEFIHKISNPRNEDGTFKHDQGGNSVCLDYAETHDKKLLNKALLLARIQNAGGRIDQFRIEANGRIVVFPSMPGMTTYHHSIILTPKVW